MFLPIIIVSAESSPIHFPGPLLGPARCSAAFSALRRYELPRTKSCQRGSHGWLKLLFSVANLLFAPLITDRSHFMCWDTLWAIEHPTPAGQSRYFPSSTPFFVARYLLIAQPSFMRGRPCLWSPSRRSDRLCIEDLKL